MLSAVWAGEAKDRMTRGFRAVRRCGVGEARDTVGFLLLDFISRLYSTISRLSKDHEQEIRYKTAEKTERRISSPAVSCEESRRLLRDWRVWGAL